MKQKPRPQAQETRTEGAEGEAALLPESAKILAKIAESLKKKKKKKVVYWTCGNRWVNGGLGRCACTNELQRTLGKRVFTYRHRRLEAPIRCTKEGKPL